MGNLDLYNNVKAVPDTAKKEIKAGRLKGMTDINPMWRIKTLTEHFGECGVGWWYEIISKDIYPGANDEVVATVDIALYTAKDGVQSKPIIATGGSKLVAQERSGMYTNDEAFKMALTDAISVACKSLGFGADVYWEKDRTKYSLGEESPAGKQTPDPAKDKIAQAERVTPIPLATKADLQAILDACGGDNLKAGKLVEDAGYTTRNLPKPVAQAIIAELVPLPFAP